ncbi:MAG: hypothetical protein A2Y88_08275 [Chloroflexi bacterium RBG_13_48_10]|nr:MAG: hypothetical protein A2Y88_08275 [Chloroflexi bacterium RBG_13_48_10]
MRPLRDPEGAELNHLIAVCDLAGKDILEIGCGDGEFTRQFAGLTHKVIGIDPEISDLNIARNDKTALFPNACYIQSIGERLPFPPQIYDLVIFACSL